MTLTLSLLPASSNWLALSLQGSASSFPGTGSRLMRSLPGSSLIVQFITDPRYQDFLSRATTDEVLGVQCRVAALTDLFQGKLWAAADPERRPTKRAKDELDLLRIADTYPKYIEFVLSAFGWPAFG